MAETVTDPWDETEPLVWIRCKKCGCTNRFDESQKSEAAEIIAKGCGLRRHGFCRRGFFCNCHTGVYPLPELMVKREVA